MTLQEELEAVAKNILLLPHPCLLLTQTKAPFLSGSIERISLLSEFFNKHDKIARNKKILVVYHGLSVGGRDYTTLQSAFVSFKISKNGSQVNLIAHKLWNL